MTGTAIKKVGAGNIMAKFKLQGHGGSNYPYVVARVKAKRTKLLKKDDYMTLLGMKTSQITRYIQDLDYKDQIDRLAVSYTGVARIEYALEMNLEETQKQIHGFCKGELKEMVGDYLERRNIRCLQYILRGKLFGTDLADLRAYLSLSGDKNRAAFFLNLMERESFDDMLEGLSETPYYEELLRIRKEHGRKEHGGIITMQPFGDALDKMYYVRLLQEVKGRKGADKLFLQYLGREIDLTNLQTLCQLKLSRSYMAPTKLMIPEGELLVGETLKELSEAGSLRKLLEVLEARAPDYYLPLKDVFLEAERTGRLLYVVMELKKLLVEGINKFSYMKPLSILPIINFLVRKSIEVDNLRILSRGKEYGLSEEEIRKHLIIL